MKRITLPKKVFLFFSSLSAMTFLVALTVYVGLDVLQKSQTKIQLLYDFRSQVKTLETFHPHYEYLDTLGKSNTFETEIEKTRKIAETIRRFHSGLGADLTRRLMTVLESLGYYRDAYRELREKYVRDHQFAATDPTFLLEHMGEHVSLPEIVHEETHNILGRLSFLRMQTIHTRDLTHIQEMKELSTRILRLTDDLDVQRSVNRIIRNTEDNYINYLAINK